MIYQKWGWTVFEKTNRKGTFCIWVYPLCCLGINVTDQSTDNVCYMWRDMACCYPCRIVSSHVYLTYMYCIKYHHTCNLRQSKSPNLKVSLILNKLSHLVILILQLIAIAIFGARDLPCNTCIFLNFIFNQQLVCKFNNGFASVICSYINMAD